MTNPTPHGQVPEALRLADWLQNAVATYPQTSEDEPGGYCQEVDQVMDEAAAELRRLHAYCQELESQVILDCMTHVQNPAEIEHVAGDVSKNGAEVNMSTAQPVAQQGEASEPTPPKGEELRALSDRYWGREDLRDAHAAGVTCGFALGVRALRTQQPAPAGATYKDSTPGLHVGDSAFESWYSAYNPAHKADKQRARDAYAAGMGDPLVIAAPTLQPAPATQQEPVAWYVTGCGRLLDEDDAKAEARHIGGTARAMPLYTAPQPSPTPQAAESVLEDAARYRWLRRWKGQEHEPPFTVQHEIEGTLWGGDLDAAIDAAMAANGGNK